VQRRVVQGAFGSTMMIESPVVTVTSGEARTEAWLFSMPEASAGRMRLRWVTNELLILSDAERRLVEIELAQSGLAPP